METVKKLKLRNTFSVQKFTSQLTALFHLKRVDCSRPRVTKFTSVLQFLHVNDDRSFKVSQGHACALSAVYFLLYQNLQQPKPFSANYKLLHLKRISKTGHLRLT